MSAKWIFTERTHGDRWAGLGLRSAGGIGASEWFDITGGAAFLLAPDGKWNEGGRWHLFYLSPGSSTPVPADHLLAAVDPVYERSPVHWAEVEARCVEFVNHLLGGQVTPFAEILENYRQTVAEREAASRASADEESVAVEPEPAGRD